MACPTPKRRDKKNNKIRKLIYLALTMIIMGIVYNYTGFIGMVFIILLILYL